MKLIENPVLPEACTNCTDDCGECEFALDRWTIDRRSELEIAKKRKTKLLNKLIEEIVEINMELAKLDMEEEAVTTP